MDISFPLSLVHALRERAIHERARLVYRFLSYATHAVPQELELTYGELDRRARAVAAMLQECAAPGERALLVYPTGPDYMAAFLGCLYAGIIAVPAYPPEFGRQAGRLEAIALDCRPVLALTTSEVEEKSRALFLGAATPENAEVLKRVRWIATDGQLDGLGSLWRERLPNPEDVAFLQYTSGSSGEPKGVIVRHSNLTDNLQQLHAALDYRADDHHVTWLPPYHDMGLIGTLLPAIYSGHSCTVMSPFAFLRNPYRWLQQMTLRRATIIGAPNFAYELCARKVPPGGLSELDLRSLRLAFCGAEPVRDATMRRFAETFAQVGLSERALCPAYGLAECTVLASMKPLPERVRALGVDPGLYARGQVEPRADSSRQIVACGRPISRHHTLVVDPDTRRLCGERRIGEIWISGPSVAAGYWGKADATRATFGGELSDDAERSRYPGPFLRTGDLAFMHEGQIYVAGRLKDLIIVHGVNHYPQDLERTVEGCHTALRAGGGVAFSVEDGDEEQVVILHELNPGKHDFAQVFASMRGAVREVHGLDVRTIVFIERGTLLKTTSGKVARKPNRRAFEGGELRIVAVSGPCPEAATRQNAVNA